MTTVWFLGTLFMLDLLAIRVKLADVARMCWAAERLGESGDVASLLTGIPVRAEHVQDQMKDGRGRRHYVNLQRVGRDAEIYVIC